MTVASDLSAHEIPNRIIVGDCIEEMARLPEKSVDLVFADPPYNLQLGGDLLRPDNSKVDAVDDDWDRFDSFEAYDAFTIAWLTACRRVLKDDGALWVIGSYHNIFRVGRAVQDLGFWILNDVVWRKIQSDAELQGHALRQCPRNPDLGRQVARGAALYLQLRRPEDGQRRAADALGLDPAAVHRRGAGQGRDGSQGPSHPEARGPAASGDPVLDPAGRRHPRSVLRSRAPPARRRAAWAAGSSASSGRRATPTSPASALPRWSRSRPTDLDVMGSKKSEPRVPFGQIVEAGLLRPGDTVWCPKGERAARVRADGSLAMGELTGSIHKVGAMVQSQPACNGWTYWHFKTDKGLAPIDVLRAKIRAEMG